MFKNKKIFKRIMKERKEKHNIEIKYPIVFKNEYLHNTKICFTLFLLFIKMSEFYPTELHLNSLL